MSTCNGKEDKHNVTTDVLSKHTGLWPLQQQHFRLVDQSRHQPRRRCWWRTAPRRTGRATCRTPLQGTATAAAASDVWSFFVRSSINISGNVDDYCDGVSPKSIYIWIKENKWTKLRLIKKNVFMTIGRRRLQTVPCVGDWLIDWLVS